MRGEPDTMHGSHTPDRVKELDEPKDDEFSETERAAFEGSVWTKLDRWVLPICTIFYLLSFLVCSASRFATLTAQIVEDL